MKIIQLTSENIKCLKAVQIKPDGSLVVIGGRNGAGKTCVLDSIQYAMDGKSSIPSKPIREGQKKAKIVLELDDLRVIRTFKVDGSKLVVESKNGAQHRSPQAMLDKLKGDLSFDPQAFSQMSPAEQVATLKAVAGLDFSKLDAERLKSFEERAAINRQKKLLDGQLAGMPEVDAPDAEVSIAEVSKQYEAACDLASKRKGLQSDLQNAVDEARRAGETVASLEQQQKDIVQAISGATAYKDETKHRSGELADKINLMPVPNTEEIRKQMDSVEQTNTLVRQKKQRAALVIEVDEQATESEKLTDVIAAIDDEKAKTLTAAKLPIKGLGFDEDGVTLSKLPFDQCSSAEQLRVSVAMGLALNPELKVLLIRDGSLLDNDSLAMVAEMAEKADAQVWVERVSDGEECQVVIEDGMVKDS